MTVRRRTVVRPPLSSVGMGPCSSIRLRSAQAQTFMVSRRPCAVKEACHKRRLRVQETAVRGPPRAFYVSAPMCRVSQIREQTCPASPDGATSPPTPSPPRECLLHVGAWRRGGRESQGGGGPLAPHLLENLSLPPAKGAPASTSFLAGGGPPLRYGLLREGRGGGERRRNPFRSLAVARKRKGKPTACRTHWVRELPERDTGRRH